jgi:hypothetical protein
MSAFVRVRPFTALGEWPKNRVPERLLWRWDFNDPRKTGNLLGHHVEQTWQGNFYAEAHFTKRGLVRVCLFREAKPRGVFVKSWLESIVSLRKVTAEEGKAWILKIIAYLKATTA